jgi:hypothetical protein
VNAKIEKLLGHMQVQTTEIAAAEKINESYVSRNMRLTLLARDIVEAILVGRQPAGLKLDILLRRFPVGWREQRELILTRTFGSTRVD